MKITLEKFKKFCKSVEGKSLPTVTGKFFSIQVEDENIYYIPSSTGKHRSQKWIHVFEILEKYKKTKSLITTTYTDVSVHAAYVIALIKLYKSKIDTQSYNSAEAAFYESVKKSMNDSAKARLERLRRASKKPECRLVYSSQFVRNHDVVAEVLKRAKGCCAACKRKAPFKRKSDGKPYLEVHHIVFLSDGGEDTVDNAQALCPNCHRQKHFG
ncbi:5-methylcytosine-specific restriction endonuclease McrA [Ereboglobus sp. PH5-5]|uniref:HNH endonuclease n=1 Tax=Ereboglobus sp. PH5-5 TaxID=2940529 RepID=UPI0024053024|nr:HNH endonuclease [Ereboglobus sp. PH5-5]MDF9833810.1 5-methylcytosine-specific restriction endonuclease McrA [Ereboglobus sp. PH5-5]